MGGYHIRSHDRQREACVTELGLVPIEESPQRLGLGLGLGLGLARPCADRSEPAALPQRRDVRLSCGARHLGGGVVGALACCARRQLHRRADHELERGAAQEEAERPRVERDADAGPHVCAAATRAAAPPR